MDSSSDARFPPQRRSVFSKHVEQLRSDLTVNVAMPHRLRQRARICQTDRRLACAQRQEIALDAQALLLAWRQYDFGRARRGRRCTSRCLRRLELTGLARRGKLFDHRIHIELQAIGDIARVLLREHRMFDGRQKFEHFGECPAFFAEINENCGREACDRSRNEEAAPRYR